MLEIKNLCKTYKTKGGVVVKALDDVSIKFPETGMVFLLGKSGSGKSTLLNVTGGLDTPDSGEIIIKGRNSKTFSGSDFDSYRNTFIGFIFQEYNILNEFNIEQNISLALQLQGKRNDKEAVDNILKQVDLEGYGKRKPNTLSGGQKQRIAIARALIKNPEIIMADEPTGALDSNTGKQVFDTLKKLSETKLVIIVSHDRDFAEIYGDRIIELADGKIIKDVTKEVVDAKVVSDNVLQVNDNVLSIKTGKDLSKDDMQKLYDILKEKEGEIIISSGDNKTLKEAMHIRSDNKSNIFDETKEINIKEYDGSKTKFIKSRLPMARAFKMGASSLKTKPIRMIFTVFLTIVSLIMFGVASTLLFYDANYSITTAFENYPNDCEAITKNTNYINHSLTLDFDLNEIRTSDYDNSTSVLISEKDIERLNNNNVGHNYCGVISFTTNILSANNTRLSGFACVSKEYMDSNHFTLIEGKHPTTSNELAISKLMADQMMESDKSFIDYTSILNYKFNTYVGKGNNELSICGIYDLGPIPSYFNDKDQDAKVKAQYEEYIKSSYHTLGFVCSAFVDKYEPYNNNSGDYMSMYMRNEYIGGKVGGSSQYVPAELIKRYNINWSFCDLNGKEVTFNGLNDNEIYLSYYEYQYMLQENYRRKVSMLENMTYTDRYCPLFSSLSSTEKENVKEIIQKYNNYNSESSLLDELMERYLPEYLTHYYNISRIEYILSGLKAKSMESLLSDYDDISTKLNNYKYNDSATEDDYNELLALVEIKDYKDYLEYGEALYMAKMGYNAREYYSNDSLFISIIDSLEADDGNISKNNIDYFREKYSEYLSAFNDNLTSYGYALGYSETFLDDILEGESTPYCYLRLSDDSKIPLKVLGYCKESNSVIINHSFIKQYITEHEDNYYLNYRTTEYVGNGVGKFDGAITKTSFDRGQIQNLLQKENDHFYLMTNSTFLIINQMVSVISVMQKVFLYTGIAFAVFASLMLFNFISSSISSKTKDIGILRAVGARGSDLFKIFFSESGIIALICMVISIVSSAFICIYINQELSRGMGFNICEFGVLNMGIIIAGSILISIIGTFIPVYLASRKAPIDSIRTL